MIFKWESSKEKLQKSMSIPPKIKMEWLRQMNEFSEKYTPAETKKIRRALKEAQSLGRSIKNFDNKKT